MQKIPTAATVSRDPAAAEINTTGDTETGDWRSGVCEAVFEIGACEVVVGAT
ncbi:hypothetical protein ABG768_011251, partial [Culter alburnus]